MVRGGTANHEPIKDPSTKITKAKCFIQKMGGNKSSMPVGPVSRIR